MVPVVPVVPGSGSLITKLAPCGSIQKADNFVINFDRGIGGWGTKRQAGTEAGGED